MVVGRKRLNIFHKLAIGAFFVQIAEFFLDYTDIVDLSGWYNSLFFSRISSGEPLGALDAFVLKSLQVLIFDFSAITFLLLLTFFIIGCIQSNVRKKTATINYWLFMLILFVNSIAFCKTISTLGGIASGAAFFSLFIFGLTRKWWEVKGVRHPLKSGSGEEA